MLLCESLTARDRGIADHHAKCIQVSPQICGKLSRGATMTGEWFVDHVVSKFCRRPSVCVTRHPVTVSRLLLLPHFSYSVLCVLCVLCVVVLFPVVEGPCKVFACVTCHSKGMRDFCLKAETHEGFLMLSKSSQRRQKTLHIAVVTVTVTFILVRSQELLLSLFAFMSRCWSGSGLCLLAAIWLLRCCGATLQIFLLSWQPLDNLPSVRAPDC